MVKFKDRLKELRVKQGLTQEMLAEKLNMGKSTIGMYENGKRLPSFEIEEEIADFFNVDLDYLRGRSNKNTSNASLVNSSINAVEMDVYGLASAGNGSLDVEPRKETFIIGSDEKIPNNSIVIGVVGDSMEPTLYEGDRILINTNDCTEWQMLNNKIVVVDINEERLVKVVRFNNFVLEFHSLNQFYPPVVVKQGDEVKCLGVLVELLKRNMRKIKF